MNNIFKVEMEVWQYGGQHLWQSIRHLSAPGGLAYMLPLLSLQGSGTVAGTALTFQGCPNLVPGC